MIFLKRQVHKNLLHILVLLTLFLTLGTPAQLRAQAKANTPNLTAEDLNPWLDGFMNTALHINEIEGAAVVIVKDGKILTQRGYGFADAAKKIPVNPETTIFRPGSISKLFVWTAIMQLVEQGKIDLDADINTYLDFKISGKAGKKITVRHLMTHRAGFEEVGKSPIFSDTSLLKPLGSFLKTYTPARIFAPGSTPAYSNYGASLTGYIVQRVSGLPFETYVERNIFGPLGMTKSSFRQPLPKALKPFMSGGYDLAGGAPKPFELINDVPAGSLSASSGDMARFMLAHLAAEQAPDGKLLKPETAKLMHRTVIKNFPDLNGMALGFYESNINGRKVIAHGGDLYWFHSDLFLFIDDGIGIYVTTNSAGSDTLNVRAQILSAFADRYMPEAISNGTVKPDVAKRHLEQITGTYIGTRRLESSFARLLNLLSEIRLSADDEGHLLVHSSDKPTRFREISPYVWQEIGGKNKLAVKMEDGRPTAISISAYAPIMEFHSVAFLSSASFWLSGIFASLAILVVTLLAWPITAFARKQFGVVLTRSLEQQRLFRMRLCGAIALIASIIVWAILIVPNSDGFSDANNSQILFTQINSIFCAVVAAICVFFVVRNMGVLKMRSWAFAGTICWLTAIIFTLLFLFNFNFLKIGTDL